MQLRAMGAGQITAAGKIRYSSQSLRQISVHDGHRKLVDEAGIQALIRLGPMVRSNT